MSNFETENILKVLQNYELSLTERRLALLEDTFRYYSADPYSRRAVGKSDRVKKYRIANRASPVGRFLFPHAVKYLKEQGLMSASTDKLLQVDVAIVVIPSYLLALNAKGSKFLEAIEGWHDNKDNWQKNKVSMTGVGRYRDIQLNIENNIV